MLENTMIACVIAILAVIVERRVRSKPAVAHVMWLTVLLVLVLPPLNWRSPIAVRGLFKPHIENIEAAAWDRFDRTDPSIGRFLDGGPMEYADREIALGDQIEQSSAIAASEHIGAEHLDATVFSLAPQRDGAGVLGTPVLRRPSGSALSVPNAVRNAGRVVWLGGAVFVLVVFLVRVRRTDRLVRMADRAGDRLQSQIRSVAAEIGSSVPETRVVSGIVSPMVWGLGRPILIWPSALDAEADGVRGLMAHELAHLRRRDHWIALFEVFVTALLWWHPLARIAMGRMDRFAEQACDVWAVRAVSGRRREYAEALIGVVERLSGSGRARPMLAATGQGRRDLADRLGIVMRPDSSPSCSRSVLLSAIILLALLVPTIAPAQPADTKSEIGLAELDDQIKRIAERSALAHHAQEWFEALAWKEAAEQYAVYLGVAPTDVDARARYAIALLQLDDHVIAERELRTVLESCVHEAEIRFWLAGALSGQGRLSEARTELETAISLGLDIDVRLRSEHMFAQVIEDDASSTLLATSAQVHELRRAARKAMSNHDTDAAIESLETLAVLAPRDGSTWHYLSYVRIAAGQYKQALESLKIQRELHHRVEVAFYNEACVFALLGKTAKAIEAFNLAVENGFRDYELAQTDSDLASIQHEKAFKAAIERVIRPARLKREIQVAREFADWNRVVDLAEELAAEASGSQQQAAYAERAVALAERGEVQVAIDSLHALLDDGYSASDGLFRLGVVHAIAGDEQAALSVLVAAARAGMSDRDRLSEESHIQNLIETDQFKQAMVGVIERRELKSFRVASWDALENRARTTLDRHADVALAKHELGWALLRQGRYEEAERVFRALAESGWNVAASSYNVACCAVKQGRKDEAMDWLERAAEAGTRDPKLFVSDRDLRPLRGMPRFEALIERLRLDARP